MAIRYLLLSLICGLLAACSVFHKAHTPQAVQLGFYNVENLFDTINAPNKDDDYFLPSGPTNWNSHRYHKKLDQLSQVYNEMGKPELFGVSEIENAAVVADLAAKFDNQLEFVHFESPDNRGIDVALLYSKAFFKLKKKNFIRIIFPDSIVVDYTSRDILHALLETKSGQELHVFVNHWPSRRGGLVASSPKREHVANTLRDYIDQEKINPKKEAVLMMGDFNDEPSNKSISEQLDAGRPGTGHTFFSMMHDIADRNEGSYNYRGTWNALDQFIVSPVLLNGNYADFELTEVEVFKRDFMIYRDKKYGNKPNRTYGGPNYYGGFSDHYPIRAKLHY